MAGENKRKIGTELSLDGERAFKQAIQGINKDMAVLGSEMAIVTAKFGKNADSMESLTAKQAVYNKQIDLQKEKVNDLKAALDDSAKAYGENDDRTKNWQIALNRAEADLAKTENTLRDTTKQISGFGSEATETGKEVEKAGDKAEKSGKDAEKGESGWNKLGDGLGNAAKAAGVAVGAMAAAAAGAAIGLGKAVVTSFGELEQNLGGSEAVFGQYAKSIQKTGEDAYKNLGVSQSEYLASANKVGALFQGAGIDQERSLELTEKALQRATDAASVMGIDTSAALEAITGAAKGNYAMMDNLGVAMSDTSLKAYALSNGLDYGEVSKDQAKKAELAMEYFFEKTSQYEGNFAKEATESVAGSFGLLSASWASMLAGFGNEDADMSNLTKNFTDAFEAVLRNVTPIIDNLVQSIPRVFDALLPAISGLLPQLLTTAVSLFNSLLAALIELLPTLIPVVVDALLLITNTLVENLPLIIDAAMTLIVTLAQGIASALPELTPTIVDTVMMIVDTLIDNIDLLVDASLAIIMALSTGLIDALPRLVEKVPVIIEKLITALATNLPKLLSAGVQLIVALGGGLIQAIPQLVGKIPQIITSIVTGFGTGISKLGDVGKNLMRGVWDGIQSMATWLKDKVTGFFTGIVTSIKDILGIRSPSRVFAGIGKNMALGLGGGFGDEMDAVARQINGSIPTSIDLPANMAGRGGSGWSGGPNIYLDGRLLTTATGRRQSTRNQAFSRAVGVPV